MYHDASLVTSYDTTAGTTGVKHQASDVAVLLRIGTKFEEVLFGLDFDDTFGVCELRHLQQSLGSERVLFASNDPRSFALVCSQDGGQVRCFVSRSGACVDDVAIVARRVQ